MNHKVGLSLLVSALLIVSVIALAKPNTAASSAAVAIPERAIEVAPGVFSLGAAVMDGRQVNGFMIVDYRKGFGHKPGHNPPGGGGDGGSRSTCYAFLAKGAKWKAVEPWLVNAGNTEGLGSSFVFNTLTDSIQKWEDASSADILGNGNITAETLVADTASPDGRNEVYFGDVGSPGAIAVTIIWGIFAGPPNQRELIEWDQIYDQADFNWSDSGEAGSMDFENIATHELGHSAGMDHPGSTCTEETMYAFAEEGETKKRTLNSGDIAGITGLYS